MSELNGAKVPVFITFLANLFARLRPSKTLDKAVSIFTKAVAELDAVAAAAVARREAAHAQIANLAVVAQDEHATVEKAAQLSDKLRALVG